MRVLILGSGGLIGQAIAASAKSASAYIVGATRSRPTGAIAEHERVIADRAVPSTVFHAVSEKRIDVVIDVAAYTAEDTSALLHKLDGTVQRYVLISSCDVYRNYGLLHRKENAAPVFEAMDESAPLRASRYPYRMSRPRPADNPDRWMDDYDKIPIEQAVARLRSDWTVLRLPMVFGPGDKRRRFQWALAPMLGHAEVLAVPSAWADWVTTYGYVDNVAAAVTLAALHPNASRSVFNIGDFEPVSHRVWIERLRTATGWTGELRETFDEQSPLARAIADLDLTVPLRCSTARLMRSLAFRPPVDLQTAVESTVRDEAARA